MTRMVKRILVPVDFSEPSLRALDYAVEFGRPFKPELIVLHVVEAIYPLAGNMYAPGYALGLVSQEFRRAAREQLSRLATRLQKRRVRVRPLLSVGAPHDAIITTGKKLKADLIIMSTQGRTGLSHMLLGSVAEKVVRSATCPVLTVRGAKPRTRSSPRRGRAPTGRRRRGRGSRLRPEAFGGRAARAVARR